MCQIPEPKIIRLSQSSCDTLVLPEAGKEEQFSGSRTAFILWNKTKEMLPSFICWLVWPWGSFLVGWKALILGTVSEHWAQRTGRITPLVSLIPTPLSLTPTLGQVPTCPSGVLLLTGSQDDYVLITPAVESEGEWEESSRLAPQACRLPRPQHCTNESKGSGWAHTGGQGLLPRAKRSQGERPEEELAAGTPEDDPFCCSWACVKSGIVAFGCRWVCWDLLFNMTSYYSGFRSGDQHVFCWHTDNATQWAHFNVTYQQTEITAVEPINILTNTTDAKEGKCIK